MNKIILVLWILLAGYISSLYSQNYPFNLPADFSATLNVNIHDSKPFNNKLIGVNIAGFTSDEQKSFIQRFHPIGIRFPSGLWSNFYDWKIDTYARYDTFDNGNWGGMIDGTIPWAGINNYGAKGTKIGFPELTELHKQMSFDVLWTYGLNYDSNAKTVARLLDSDAKGFDVKDIELGNEQFWTDQRSYKISTPEKYYTVAKSLSDTLKSVKPELNLSIPLSWRTSHESYNKTLTADTSYFDAISAHVYVNFDKTATNVSQNAYKGILTARLSLANNVNYLHSFAPHKLVWLTEWGVNCGEGQAAAFLGMADCYLYIFENPTIYDRTTWYCVNGYLNSFLTFTDDRQNVKYPLEKTGYGSIYEIIRSVFENSEILESTMTTIELAPGSNAVNARMVIKNGKKIVFAVNLSNQPVVLNINLNGTPFDKSFTHEAFIFDSLSQAPIMDFDANPLSLVKSDSGTITLPALSVSKISESTAVAVNELVSEKDIQIYPNPSKNGFFKLKERNAWIVNTFNGVKILQGEGNFINLSSHSKGLYIVNINHKKYKIVNE